MHVGREEAREDRRGGAKGAQGKVGPEPASMLFMVQYYQGVEGFTGWSVLAIESLDSYFRHTQCMVQAPSHPLLRPVDPFSDACPAQLQS